MCVPDNHLGNVLCCVSLHWPAHSRADNKQFTTVWLWQPLQQQVQSNQHKMHTMPVAYVTAGAMGPAHVQPASRQPTCTGAQATSGISYGSPCQNQSPGKVCDDMSMTQQQACQQASCGETTPLGCLAWRGFRQVCSAGCLARSHIAASCGAAVTPVLP